jgi:uracil-DNA glycosylase
MIEWEELKFFKSETFDKVINFLNAEKCNILPAKENIYNAMHLTPFNEIKIVILGQDPYPSGGHAHGLSFSTLQPNLPKSLKNIFVELQTDLGIVRDSGNLTDWAKQGVLLLNTVLTVQENNPNSHRGIGWEALTDEIITCINDYSTNVVFILWGKQAQQKLPFINQNKHLVIQSAHPSPLSAYRGFFGSKPFSQINNYLTNNFKHPINW